MIARISVPVPIVITGLAGSGKSKLARAIANVVGCEPTNVGTVLQNELANRRIVVQHRRDIGPLFFEHFGKRAYFDVVFRLLGVSSVIDGVRLMGALREARGNGLVFYHVTRASRPGWPLASTEPFAADIQALVKIADHRVEWMNNVAELDAEARTIVRLATLYGKR